MTSPNLSSVAAALALLEGHPKYTKRVNANVQFRDYLSLLEQTVRALLGPAADGPALRLARSPPMIGDVEGAVETVRDLERLFAAGRFADS